MITRRRFLTGAAGATVIGGGAAAAAHGLRRQPPTTTTRSVKPGTGTLVLVALYGGNDGLNTLVPYHDAAYLGGRPTLGFQPNEVIPLDAGLALNPGLKGLKSLWDAHQLAVVRGVGYPSPNYSHFRSMDIWQSGVPDGVETSGWLGRWLDGLGGTDPLAAISVGATLPKLLQGNVTAGSAIPAGALTLGQGGRVEKPFAALESVVPGESSLAARVAQSGTDLLTVVHSVNEVLGKSTAASNPAAGSALAGQLDLVTRLIKGGLPSRVYVVSAGGFDTHVDEKQAHQRLLTEVDAAVTDFVHAMASDPRGAGVVLMTFSEFGRRVAQNASGGTDHGSAGPLFVAGPGVRGGFYGEEPSLTDLDNGNLKFSTDFRSVYTTVLGRVLGVDPKPVLSGKSFPELPFV